MERIDTSGWEPFKIGDLFEKLQLGIKNENFNKTLDVSEVRTAEFNLPLVNAKHGNNGIMYFGREEDFETAEMTIDIVQNGAIATGDVYAQPQRTGVLWDAYLIKPKETITSEYVLMFIASVLEKAIKDKFSYDNKCVWDKASQLMVYLPATVDGKPDYAYMDQYMHDVMEESEASLENLRRADKTKEIVDAAEWQDFWLRDLFDFKLPQGDLQVKQVEDGDISLITPSAFKNGLLQRISSESKSTLFPANTLTVDMFGNAYYQEEDYFVTAHGHVNVLLPRIPLNKNNGMFIATAIRSMFLKKYGFSEMCTQKVLKNEKVRLPVLKDGKPDCDYMDAYMSDMLEKTSASLDMLVGVAS